ncbi:MAG: glutaredoxin family protein [Betaproteobacteria bacterium]|nr:glutaredoxin family protein [Betaproteobacteria bacterium]
MALALQPLLATIDATIDVVDIDRHPALEEAYGTLVPVLLHREMELCHYFLDATRVRDYLTSLG